MKTFDEIKNELAIEKGWKSFKELYSLMPITELFWKEVCRRAQIECARETLQKAETMAILRGWKTDMPISDLKITDEANIKLIQ
jgi:hypothetical protein